MLTIRRRRRKDWLKVKSKKQEKAAKAVEPLLVEGFNRAALTVEPVSFPKSAEEQKAFVEGIAENHRKSMLKLKAELRRRK